MQRWLEAVRPQARQRERWRSILPALGMALIVAAIYCPPEALGPGTLLGIDFRQIHGLRLEYAREWIAQGHLPAWHTRELLGGPFLANLQSFPWIPTRLALLLVPPEGAHLLGVVGAAVLSSLFTYLLARRLGQSKLGAALAGFTFACSGYFASRVLAGHLPLLEAYPAAPLLLWAVESLAQAGAAGRPRTAPVLALAGATACATLAGHPQIPAYAIGAGLLYAALRGRAARCAIPAMAFGGGVALFAWVPMFHLIGESARVLPLFFPASINNDVALPWSRLLAFVDPWGDGAPPEVGGGHPPFRGPVHVSGIR